MIELQIAIMKFFGKIVRDIAVKKDVRFAMAIHDIFELGEKE